MNNYFLQISKIYMDYTHIYMDYSNKIRVRQHTTVIYLFLDKKIAHAFNFFCYNYSNAKNTM